MEKTNPKYAAYLEILEEELVPAMGCTEPIAIAFAAAKGRALLGALPDQVVVEASGNIIKNVKSVVVPNTGGLRGGRRCRRGGRAGGPAAGGHLPGNGGTAERNAYLFEGTPRPGGISRRQPGI